MIKLIDISKTVISRYKKEEVYNYGVNWAEEYDPDLKELLENDKEYTLKVLGIERGNEKPRKDIAKWSDLKQNIEYMYDNRFLNKDINYEYQKVNERSEIKKIVETYLDQMINKLGLTN